MCVLSVKIVTTDFRYFCMTRRIYDGPCVEIVERFREAKTLKPNKNLKIAKRLNKIKMKKKILLMGGPLLMMGIWEGIEEFNL